MHSRAERAGQAYLSRITASHHGIHLRLNSFIRQMQNGENAVLVASLRRIMLDDLWFYRQAADAGEAQGEQDAQRPLYALIGLCETLLEKDSASAERFRLMATLVDFLVGLYEPEKTAGRSAGLMREGLALLEQHLRADRRTLIKCSGLVKKLVPLLKQPQAPVARLTRLLKKALEANLAFWEDHLDAEPWHRKFAPHLDTNYSGLVSNLARTVLTGARQKLRSAENAQELAAVDDYNAVGERVVGLLERFSTVRDKISFCSTSWVRRPCGNPVTTCSGR